MGKRKRDLERLQKRKEWEKNVKIDKEMKFEHDERAKYKIPKEEAFVKFEDALLADVPNACYVLVFGNYNHKQCGLIELQKSNDSESLVKLLDLLSKAKPSSRQTITKDTILRSSAEGGYRSLFSTVPDDIDQIYEAAFAGEGRVFFFTLETAIQRNFISVIAIKPTHIPVD